MMILDSGLLFLATLYMSRKLWNRFRYGSFFFILFFSVSSIGHNCWAEPYRNIFRMQAVNKV